MKEIVGAKIGDTITNDPFFIRNNLNSITRLLDRDTMKLMASCGLGENWENMANGPTLFRLDDNGKPISAA